MSGALIVAGVVLGVLVTITMLVLPPVYYFERRACSNRATEMRMEWKFKMIGGCFVELPSGRFVNLSNIRFTEQGKILVEP